jgi:hypothetical protein
MNSKLAIGAIAIALAAVPFGAQALGKNEKGCLVGGAAGGIGGHLMGDHAVLGAAAGCAVGAVVANERDKKQQAAKRHDSKVARNYNRDYQSNQEPARQNREMARERGTPAY